MNKKIILITGAVILVGGAIAILCGLWQEANTPDTILPTLESIVPTATTTPTTTPAVKIEPVKTVPVQIENPDAEQLFSLTNADRVSNGLKPLVYDLTVERAADGRAGEIAATGYFSHTASGDWQYRLRYWLDSVGAQWSYGGENLAEGFTTMQDAENAFLASPTHKDNILKPEYTAIGISTSKGLCQNADTCGQQYGKETTFLVVIFITKPN